MNPHEDKNGPSELQPLVADAGTVALLNSVEIDIQITTAKKYPRSIKQFRSDALSMVTLNEVIASECFYALPRKQRNPETNRFEVVNIEGPSARFGEIIASAWGNCRAGARVVDESGDFVTAQGVFHDLQNNVAITYEVRRRIVDRNGNRFSADLIGVTANAASSIALRNAILKGVPKAFWSDVYDAARRCAIGDFKTIANRRADTLKELQKYGVSAEQVIAHFGIKGVEDILQDELIALRGLLTALRDGETTVEETFGAGKDAPPVVPRKSAKPADSAPAPAPAPQATEAPPWGDEPPPADKTGAPIEPLRAPEPMRAGELASPGERGMLRSTVTANRLPMRAVLDDVGATGVDVNTLDGLTKEQFRLAMAKLR